MQRILIIGAASSIAEATARRYAERGDAIFLAARDAARLEIIAADLRVRGSRQVGLASFDVNHLEAHEPMVAEAHATLGGLDVVLIAHGTLPDQGRCERSVDLMLSELQTNAVSTLALMTRIAARLEAQGTGSLAVISSVAGDRGRQSNYVYGAAKAAVSTFAGGLRQRLAKRGITVVTIKPGFVDTPMTRDFPKGALWASPATIAAGIVEAIDRKRSVVYLPWFWRPIMWMIRTIPESLFKRLKF